MRVVENKAIEHEITAMTDAEYARFDYMRSLMRADLLKLCRSMNISANRIKDKEDLAMFIIKTTRYLHNCTEAK